MAKAVMIVAAALVSGCVAAVQHGAAQLPMTAAEIVSARQAAFQMSGAAMGNMKATIDRGGDVKGQAYAARGVARWARVLPTMFPDSSATVTPTRARPEIWTNRADFNAKAADYAAAAARLAEVAAAGDREAFAEQFRATSQTCAACHTPYQVPLARGN